MPGVPYWRAMISAVWPFASRLCTMKELKPCREEGISLSEERSVLNVNSASSDWRAYALANFPLFPFLLDGATIASVEGFVQGIKFPEGDPIRELAFLSHSLAAKQCGVDAKRVSVWWNGRTIPYGSAEHHKQIGRAIRAKFQCNRGAQLALQATRGLKLIHDLGPESPTTSLPGTVFCRILDELREELLQSGGVQPP